MYLPTGGTESTSGGSERGGKGRSDRRGQTTGAILLTSAAAVAVGSSSRNQLNATTPSVRSGVVIVLCFQHCEQFMFLLFLLSLLESRLLIHQRENSGYHAINGDLNY